MKLCALTVLRSAVPQGAKNDVYSYFVILQTALMEGNGGTKYECELMVILVQGWLMQYQWNI